MTRHGLAVLLSHWRRNPLQLLTLVTGLALATALWSGVQAINAEARASYAQASDTLDGGDIARVVRTDGQDITTAEYVALRRAGWLVSPVIEGRLDGTDPGIRITGIEPLTLPGRGAFEPGEEGIALPDGFLSDAGLLVANPGDLPALEPFGVPLLADPDRRAGTVLTDIATAGRLLGEDGGIGWLLLAPEQPLIRAGLPAAYTVSEPLVQNDVARLTRSFHLNLTAFGLLSFAVGIFIVYGAVGLAFEQRRGVFRTLRAMGMPLRRLMLLLVLELGVFALLAGAAGIALGYVIAAALMPDVAATLRGLYGAEVTGQLQLRPVWWLSGMAIALGGTAVAAVAALWRLVRMPLLSFNHPRAMRVQADGSARLMLVAAVVLLGAAALFAVFGSGLFAGFALLACLLTGAAFCLPLVLSKVLKLAECAANGVLSQWFWADTRQQLPGLTMALMALLLAMAANIGVSTMVSSFRLTFTGYLDQRLSADLYLRAGTPAQAGDILSFLEGRETDVLPIASAPTRIGGLPAEIFGLRDHVSYRENWPVLDAVPAVWDRLAAGDGALINEQMARREALRPGDMLQGGDTVLGIYSDYGNAAGQVIISEALFATRYPEIRPVQFGLVTDAPAALAKALQDRFDLQADALINQRDLKAFSLEIFERTFAVTAALNVLTLSVAGLAILISLLTLATMRLPQLAPVWALGLTRRDLAGFEMLRAVCLATLTGLLAVPLGLALAWVLLAVVNVEAFGWRLPMYLFAGDMLRLGGLTLLAALLAALWPAARLARTPPHKLLKVFSNER
ncbi:FtsX-like permease family protein [Roseobacter sp.]|uniref:FtsX-like permease family protein n=1 Tax=Roseobacter sp. TaxID=1907202 RepID=UPI0025D7818E|nr:FtsX-like permease family protein [Roseobacter sp.]